MDDLKTDAKIADILKKLKDTKPKDKENDKSKENDKKDSDPVVDAALSGDTGTEVNLVENSEKEDELARNEIANAGFSNEAILPWFSDSDRDTEYIHYIKFDDTGNISYGNIKSTSSASAIAALKLTKDYACDVDYFKNKHFVLYVKQLDSDYSASRSFIPTNDKDHIEVEDTKIVNDDSVSVTESFNNPELTKVSTEDITAKVSDCDIYSHFVVFTDLGIADFVARQSGVSYPYSDTDYNKWFEETSNYIQVKNARYDSNYEYVMSDKLANVNSYKYDIITMHRPGVITLDSVDSSDSSSQIHIKLKDEFSFLPMNRILKCLKYYALTENRSPNDFKLFISRYFDIA